MPELPEVETIARDLRPHLEGARVRSARVIRPDILRGVGTGTFEKKVRGRRLVRVWRRAKHLVLDLDDGNRIVIQPRMTGALLVGGGDAGPRKGRETDPYDTLEMFLDNGVRVHYRDVRRLGAVFLLAPPQWRRYEAAIGPEPLERSFTPRVLGGILSGGSLAVKKAIMDQRRLAGVGNIYASEALWMAGIDPSRPARTIGTDEIRRLHAAIVGVLRRSIRSRGTTIRDFRTGTGEAGTFQGRLSAYGRSGKPCLRCRGGKRIVMTHAIDGRATYFCPGCQR